MTARTRPTATRLAAVAYLALAAVNCLRAGGAL